MLGFLQFCPQPFFNQPQPDHNDDGDGDDNDNDNNNNNSRSSSNSNNNNNNINNASNSSYQPVASSYISRENNTSEQPSGSSTSAPEEGESQPTEIGTIVSNFFWESPIGTFLTNMGGCLSRASGAPILESPDGTEMDFHNRFIEDRVLGEGEFGVVHLVYDMQVSPKSPAEMNPLNGGSNGAVPGGGLNGDDDDGGAYACKTLRKGVVFKDNTLYAPLKPEILRGEVQMLRTLAGQHFCLEIVGVYETPRVILMVTEYCAGGEMMEYLSKQEEDLRTDDVSRISFQLLDAVDHCAKHNIMHRDIKPENIMFRHATPGSDLRLIDFGSGTNKLTSMKENGEPAPDGHHTTFAGSAFYISPEMFQRTYTQKTDVWSVGVTLYVLVAGYPADELQKAFNLLQSVNRNLRTLPKMPDNMPDSYYDMLGGMLVYRHKKRKTAGDMLSHEFVQFHTKAFSIDQIAMAANNQAEEEEIDITSNDDGDEDKQSRRGHRPTKSYSLRGSITRHTMILDYHKYERSLTALLATLLDKHELITLIRVLKEKMEAKAEEEVQEKAKEAKNDPLVSTAIVPKATRLDVIPISQLNQILEELNQDQVLAMIKKLPNSNLYSKFAYEVALLKEFVREDDQQGKKNQSVSARLARRMTRSGGSFRASIFSFGSERGGHGHGAFNPNLDSSVHSSGSIRGLGGPSAAGASSGRNHSNPSKGGVKVNVNSSVHGSGGVYKEWKAKGLINPRKKAATRTTSSRL